MRLDLQVLFERDLEPPIEKRKAMIGCTIEPAYESDVDDLLGMQPSKLPPDRLEPLSDLGELE